ncbi:SrfA family protein [Pantoea brenneri]|uniref:SrfA family protein n=1 Tax=Pantoea brenneri TaxID=472694 RepID=UPI002108989B|nr:SrfA family protein [Pantoea brenneri]
MAKTFLRSGNLDAVLALGENGQPVYASALQIRETLRLRRQGALADCLAIPQANDRGDRLDWYAPFSGRMKSWLAASDHERRAALQHLTACQQDMQALSTRARAAENPAMRLFGALLSKSLQFPDQQYVYLVDGKPVITFWGFVDAQARSRDDALACLRDTLEESLPPLLVEPPPAPVAEPVSIEPVPAEPLPVEPEPEAEPVIVPAAPAAVTPAAPAAAGRFRVWMIVPPLAIAAAVVVAVLLHRPQPVSIPAAPSATLAAVPAVRPPAVVNAAEKLAATLPQKPATVNAAAAAPAAASATLASVVTPAVPARPDDLIVTPDAVRDGQVEVIDGRWRVTLGSMPTATGKPAVMHFQFKNGKGSVQIVQDHTRCKADVSAAMTSAGNLVIESRYTAKCENKSRYRMPLLICHASIGAAVCEAQYADDRVFPMTIKRESK